MAAAPFKDDSKAHSPLEHLHDADDESGRRQSFSGLPPYEPPSPPPSPPLPPGRPSTPVHVNHPTNHGDRSSHLARRGCSPFGELSHSTKVNLDRWSRMYLPEGWVRNLFLACLQASYRYIFSARNCNGIGRKYCNLSNLYASHMYERNIKGGEWPVASSRPQPPAAE